MEGMRPAEFTVFFHFQSIRVILLIFHGVVVTLFAFGTSHSNLHSHCPHLASVSGIHPLFLSYGIPHGKGLKMLNFTIILAP